MRFAPIAALSVSSKAALAVDLGHNDNARTLAKLKVETTATKADKPVTSGSCDTHGCCEATYTDDELAKTQRPSRLPPKVDLGTTPQLKIIKRGDDLPPNWYVPDFNYFKKYGYPDIVGEFDIVAFAGGNFRGHGYCKGEELSLIHI